jgi:hypothetical protein
MQLVFRRARRALRPAMLTWQFLLDAQFVAFPAKDISSPALIPSALRNAAGMTNPPSSSTLIRASRSALEGVRLWHETTYRHFARIPEEGVNAANGTISRL